MSLFIEQLASNVGKKLKQRGWKVATAESCTAGGLAYWITSVPGSSAWFDRGFITYSNTAKEEMLGVSPLILATYGAVSEPTVREMADHALQKSQAHFSIAITGIAGPDGGSPEKPVGTVWFGWAAQNKNTQTRLDVFTGSRHDIREQAIQVALQQLLDII